MTLCNNTSIPAANCSNATLKFVWLEPATQPYDILKIIFGSLSILLNGFLLLAIFVERKKLFVSRITYLVANLALADFLIGLVLVFILQPIKKEEKPEIGLPFIWATMLVSFLTLFLMSAERFVVVALPMLWSQILTIRRTIFAICIVWCLAIISGVFVAKHKIETFFVLIVIIEVCVLFFIAVHVYILYRFLYTSNSQPAFTDDHEGTEMNPRQIPEQSYHVSEQSLVKEFAAVITILLLVLIFTIIPHFICLQMFVVDEIFDKTSSNTKKFRLAYSYTDAFSYLNFVVNPIVYAWRLKMYRRAFLNLFRSIVLFFSSICNYCFV